MSKIVSIACQAAPHQYRQKEIFSYMLNKIGWNETEERKIKFLYEKSGISNRQSVLPDFLPENLSLLYKTHDSPSVQQRLSIFNQEALPLAIEAAKRCYGGIVLPDKITHIITVSCTGMSAPGLDIDLIKSLGLSNSIDRSSVNFMGCYASIHAIKQAHYIAQASPSAVVLIVSVELCTLHFQDLNDEDNTLANMLFADGAGAVLVTSDEFEAPSENNTLKISHFHSDLLFSGEKDMSWNISDVGFQMTLSTYVPKVISADIRLHFEKLLAKDLTNAESIRFWAIHPGGRAILEAVTKQMHISEVQMRASYNVLQEHGNMSSATILFVLEEILKKDLPQKGDKTVATAFGPGLTVESVLLTCI
ncbi:MAG: type III polyketide synthase [Opitutaceae bacterium]|nr:type III polyketide synthase [Cytophagales bacterium]